MVVLDGQNLVIKRRPDTTLRMRAVRKDVFAVPSLGEVAFRHGSGNQVTGLSNKLDRIRALRFQRQP